MTALASSLPPVRTRRRLAPSLLLSLLIVVFFVAAAVIPGVLATHDPLQFDLTAALHGPSPSHLAGTDEAGRDLYSRIIFGTGESLSIGLGATALSLAIALLLGVAAGLGGRVLDAIVSRGLDVLFAFPMLLVALLFVAAFGPSPTTLVLAVGIGTAPGYARMIRAQVLAVRTSPFIEAAHAVGHPPWRVLRQHIVPNAVRPLVAVATLSIGQSIVWASGLSFLGLGVAPPSPEWGALLDAGRAYMTHAWWLEVLPGLAIVLLALAVTTIGRHLQQHLEGHRA